MKAVLYWWRAFGAHLAADASGDPPLRHSRRRGPGRPCRGPTDRVRLRALPEFHQRRARSASTSPTAPGTSLIAKVSALPGIRSSAAWLGLDANPVVHGHVDDSFLTDPSPEAYHGEYFTQDTVTVLRGRLPQPTPLMRSPSPPVWPSSSGSAWEATSPTSTRTPKSRRWSSTATPPTGSSALSSNRRCWSTSSTRPRVPSSRRRRRRRRGPASKAPSPSRGSGCG